MDSLVDEIQQVIGYYEKSVLDLEKKASRDTTRAQGGVIRSGKGEIVENIAKQLLRLAWKRLGKNESRMSLERIPIRIAIRKEYVEKLKNERVKNHIKNNIGDYYYQYLPDVFVQIDKNPVLTVECKAYSENAMMKRILVDFTLVKQKYPNMRFMLFQLESQLGGDYSDLKKIQFGSLSTHTLMSHFDINLNIITLLAGERRVDRPIHKKEFFKPLIRENLENSVDIISEILKNCA
jgi:hypothetical protein